MAEYEVESVTEARVAKKSKKVIWEYNVKWKGYSIDDNTWEPISSFSGSEDIIQNFWLRVDVDGRDIKNMTQFRVGETFVQKGPPRRNPSQRTVKPDAVASTPPASAGPSREGTRSNKRRRSSPPAVDLEETPAKRTRERVSESVTRPAQEARPSRDLPRRPPAKTTTSSARSIRRTKKRTPSPEVVPASEEEEEEDVAMLVDPEPPSFEEPPAQEEPLMDESAIEAPTEPLQDKSPSLPSHRARAAKPLVKMVDDFKSLDGAISVKARLHGRNGTSDETPVAGPSSSPRRSGRKPGPGRSSAGMLNKNTSSLLTFDKGALKTVKGKFKAPVDEEDNAQGSSFDDSGPTVPPTSDELLKLGGFDSKDAEALDDFEDEDVVASPVEVPESNPNQQSLTLAKNKLFPPGMAMAASFSNKVTSVWRRATIFGPLGLGSDATAETPSDSKPFLLKLDATVTVPLDLTDVFQSLDTLVSEDTGPPGKFFVDANALKLLDTIRAGGPSARAAVREDATEEQKAHYTRFRSRLDKGELVSQYQHPSYPPFHAVIKVHCHGWIGVPWLFFFRDTAHATTQPPPSLVSFSDSVFVTQLVIENFTAYVEVAETADTSRW
ncbi:hypothetical protein B0H19DRAFT_1166897 [Mycena capillaripes]|nr:hypothetical protein B0H19DRAFT_1166897 [Mycena capillaripes]